ncbi:hypothetical protein MTR67_039380 [Solanum verrucosum]|uniref:SET domain-containing protein n=1 Tax=Solanum verrucosum TaxID=315347 RepID=A0AAF0ZQM3_SOLVR|nr:hypothetical protein MTR67_039380 [Solanum verrucosum]
MQKLSCSGWGLLADENIKGSFARFINHSCSPNCETSKWIVSEETRVGIFVKQDISVGMELTYEYNFEWSTTMSRKMGMTDSYPSNSWIFISIGLSYCRYIVDDLPVYDSIDDESTPVISGTSGGNEHTKILNDGEGSTFKLELTNSTTKKKSQRKPKLKVKYLILTFIPCILMSRSNLGPRPKLRS